MVSVAFGVLERPARADTTAALTPSSTVVPTVAYGPGNSTTAIAGGAQVGFLGTFQRWDGVFLPNSALNLTTGNWPYLLRQDATWFTVTRLGQSFTQSKVPGATYEFRPGVIKETLVLANASAAPYAAVGVGFWGTYLPLVNGTTVSLLDGTGSPVWQSASFVARDSSPASQVYANPVQSIGTIGGSLVLHLDPSMLTWAQYPLYLDPTWILKGNPSNIWAGTLDGITSDWGDANLRLGVLADNFNDNTNEIWTVTSGHSFSLSGGRAQLTATEIHASGSWTNLTLGTTLNFASCGASNLMFRYASSSNEYYLAVSFAQKTLTLNKVINGVTTALSSALSVTMYANTNYDVKVLARGNYFEVWWAGSRIWNGTDPSPPGTPLSGNVGLSETTSKCTLYVDNVRARDPTRFSGIYTSPKRGAASGNVVTQVRYVGSADSYSDVDLWTNSSSDNVTWSGWHLVKTQAAPGFYYAVPDVDQKRYYQVRAVLRSGVDGTPSVSEIDAFETTPPPVVATTNTGTAPWYLFIGGDVNAVSGNLVLSWTDLSVRAKGFTMAVVRTYNSALAGTLGPFGLGTTDAFHAHLAFPSGGNVTYTAGDGASYTFVTMGGTAYSPPRGIHDNLIKNGDGTYTLWAPDGSRTNFDSTGKLTSLVDRNGNHLTLTYTNGNPTRVADDAGLALTFAYSGSLVTSVTDSMNRKVQYTYNAPGCANCLYRVTDPMGFTENYTSFDAANRLQVRVDRAGHIDRFVYTNGKVTEIWAGEWNYTTGQIRWQTKTYTIAYVNAWQTTATNALGGVTTANFTGLGNPTAIVGPSVGCALCRGGNATSYIWDGEFDAIAVTDGRGDTTAYAYDWMGHALSVRDALGNSTLRTYNNIQNATQFLSLLLSSKNPRGFATSYTYTANGNPYASILPLQGAPTSYRYYDAAGSLIRSQDFRGNSVTYGYDAHEFLVNSTDARGNTTTYQNDLAGRTWNTTTPLGNTTRTVYDPDDRVTSVTDPSGNTTTNAYDHRGDLTNARDANNLVTQYVLNLTFGGTNKTVDAGGNTTWDAYNVAGDLVNVTDAAGSRTAFARDAYHRETSETSPMGFITRFVYDAAGNQVARTDANGSTTRYAYDALNRLVRTTYPDGKVITQTYDADGNVADRHGLELDELYTYDNLDRATSVKETYLNSSPLLIVWENYTYDANGNQLTLSGTGGGASTSVYDANNRLWSRKDAQGRVWSYRYNTDGELTTLTYPDGEYTTYLYDQDGRETSEVTRTSGGVLLEAFVYTYDAVRNKKTMTEHRLYQSDLNIARCASAPQGGSGPGSDCTFDTDPAGLSPTSQSVTVSLRAIGSVYCTWGGCPYTDTITWYVKVVTGGNTVTYNLGSQAVSSSGGGAFDITKTGTISVANGQAIYGNVSYSVVCKSGVNPCEPIKGVMTDVLTVFYGADEGPVTYVYDKQYRLAQVTYADGSVGRYTHDAVGDRLTDTYVSFSASYTYDKDHRLTQTVYAGGASETFTYDANGNERTDYVAPRLTAYAYDYENRLVSVSESYQADDRGRYYLGHEYTYNANPTDLAPSPQTLTLSLRAAGTAQGAETITWYAVLNGVATQMGSTYSCTSCAFDQTRTLSVTLYNGDALFGEIAFTEDVNHGVTVSLLRLTYAPTTTATATYRYSGDGHRMETATPTGGTTYAANDPTGSGGLGQTTGTLTSDGTLASQTVYGPGTDNPISQTSSGSTYFLHADGQGSVTSVTNVSQGLQSSYRYDPYGASIQAAGPVSSPYRYSGAAYDVGSGLTYDRARYYDPSTGRFLSKDPYGGGYAYAGDNPVNARDPSGKTSTVFSEAGGPSLSTGIIWHEPPPTPTWATTRCLVAYAAFAVGLVLTLLGLPTSVTEDTQLMLGVVNFVGVDIIGGEVQSIVSSGTNVLGGIVAITQLIFDFAQIVLRDVLPRMIMGFFMWLSMAVNFAITFVPGELGVKLILMAYSIGLGLEGLAATGCL